jgi:hypothetical protein
LSGAAFELHRHMKFMIRAQDHIRRTKPNRPVPLRAISVAQYFFIIRRSDMGFEDNPLGKDLPNVAAALSYAEHIIGQLHDEGSDGDAELMMIVKDETQQTVLSLPFLPAFA